MSKHWICTIYNMDCTFDKEEVEYAIWQHEKCPSTDRLHIQAYVLFKTRKRLSTVKNILGEGHYEVSRSPKDSILYCSKEDTRVQGPFEYGTKPLFDKETVVQLVKKQKIVEIMESHPNLWRNVRTLQSLKALFVSPRSIPTRGILMCGPTGCGKTRTSQLIGSFLGTVYFCPDPKMQWWDGYQQEEAVIIDEVREVTEPSVLLRLMDRYPMKVPVKGGFQEFTSSVVFMTSNLNWHQLTGHLDQRTVDALKRRIDIIDFN